MVRKLIKQSKRNSSSCFHINNYSVHLVLPVCINYTPTLTLEASHFHYSYRPNKDMAPQAFPCPVNTTKAPPSSVLLQKLHFNYIFNRRRLVMTIVHSSSSSPFELRLDRLSIQMEPPKQLKIIFFSMILQTNETTKQLVPVPVLVST